MDGRSRRTEFVGSSLRAFGNSNPENQTPGQPRILPSSLQSSSSARDAPKFSTSSLATPYGNGPSLLFDPVLYSSMQRPYLLPQMHPGLPLQAGYQTTMTGLNQINPVLLLSSNDNNNCNSRSRAASHSSILEVGAFSDDILFFIYIYIGYIIGAYIMSLLKTKMCCQSVYSSVTMVTCTT